MSRFIPTFDLYGEDRSLEPDFRLHCETVASRSSTYHWEIGLHRHEQFMQFLYIWHGSGDAILDGQTMTLAPPCVVFVPPGPVHGFRFSRDIAGLVITAAGTLRRDGAERRARVIPLETGSPDTDYLHQTFHRIADEYDAARPGRPGILDAYISIITALINRSDAEAANAGGLDDANVTSWR